MAACATWRKATWRWSARRCTSAPRCWRNAPHLAQPLAFVMPPTARGRALFYGVGLKMYDALAARAASARTEFLVGARTARTCCPQCRPSGWSAACATGTASSTTRGSRWPWPARRRTAARSCSTTAAVDRAAARRRQRSRRECATTRLGRGRDSHCRAVRRSTPPASGSTPLRTWTATRSRPQAARWSRRARGCTWWSTAISCPGDHALLVPKTADGRVLFAVPWLGKTILGTTDTPRDDLRARADAVRRGGRSSSCAKSAATCRRAPTRADVRSVWVGLRPLVQPSGDDSEDTKALSREHTVLVGRSGLVTVTGGKWTTYRAMAEDVLEQLLRPRLLPRRAGRRHGASAAGRRGAARASRLDHDCAGRTPVWQRGRRRAHLPGAEPWLWRDGEGGLSEAMVRFAARHEMARTLEDVLARRCRAVCSSMRPKPPNSSNR